MPAALLRAEPGLVRAESFAPDVPCDCAAVDLSGQGRRSLRARKKRQTHDALQEAAQRLVAEQGLSQVTIEDIAAATDLSTRTFFNHFPTKEAALVAPRPDGPAGLGAALVARPAGERPDEALCAGIQQELVRQATRMFRIRELVARCPRLLPEYVGRITVYDRVVIEWASARTGVDPATSLYPSLLAGLTTEAVRVALPRWHPERGIVHLCELIEQFFALVSTRVPAPPAEHANLGSGASGSLGAGTPGSGDAAAAPTVEEDPKWYPRRKTITQ